MSTNVPAVEMRLASAALALTVGFGAHAATLQVPLDHPTIQDAVDAAADGDTIVVSDGNWEGADILGKSLTLQSASDDPSLCIIDAGFTGVLQMGADTHTLVRGFGIDGVQRGIEVNADASATVENCVIANCRIGGLFVNGPKFTMSDTLVRNNSTTNAGGGMLVAQGEVLVERCAFRGNDVTGANAYGGGVHVGGGVSMIIADSAFRNNTAIGNTSGKGGGLYVAGNGVTPLLVVDTLFAGNESSSDGGGVYLEFVDAFLGNVRFRENTSDFGGGLFIENSGSSPHSVTVANATFIRNEALTGSGGGIRNREDSILNVVNATIWDNTSGLAGGGVANGIGSTATFTNVIVRSNQPNQIRGDGETTVSYSNVQGGYDGPGNIDTAPGFVDESSDDYHLAAGSACIDAGNTAGYFGPATDLDGEPRAVDDPDTADTGVSLVTGAIDMGAHEYQPVVVDPCPSDITDDGAIDFDDLLRVLADWGPCP